MLPNGDVAPGGTASLEVFDCRRGALNVVAVGRDNTTLTLARDGATVATSDLWPRGVWQQTVPTANGSRHCAFTLSSTSLVHLERFDWVPDG